MELKKSIFAGLGIWSLFSYGAASTTVPQGTEVMLTFAQSLDSGSAHVGDHVKLTVAHDVMVDGREVIKAGTPADGVVAVVDKRGRFGKNGRLRITINPISSEIGQAIPVEPRDKGKNFKGSKTDQAAIASGGGALLLGPVGLVGGYFVAGKQVKVKPGDTIRTVVSRDIHGE
jgi:hypothetical protein